MAGLLRRCFLPFIALLLSAALAVPADACPFCTMQGQTLTQEVTTASMVLYGTLKDAKINVNSADFSDGSTDLVIEKVVKPHEVLADRKVLTLNRYLPSDKDTKYKFLVFCDVYKGKVDPYRGMPVKADSDVARYLEGAMKLKDAKQGERLRFFFDYLDNADVEVSNDAYKEFGNADYADYRDMAGKLPADKIVAWLKDAKTPAFRYGLYASMLGHCGKPEHAQVLRDMLADPEKQVGSGADGIIAGLIMLDPKEGWGYLTRVLGDEKKEFTQRYAALRAARFFWDSRPDVIDRKDVVAALGLLLEQGDIADLAIEDLRKWKRCELAPKILGLAERKTHDIPIVKRAILRYALSCPDTPEAAAYVEHVRKTNPLSVKDAEELLKLETSVPAPPAK